uniref:Uncharacterized protein n=1 Tax=Rhizophora mucronata TaxID=61149 RepID=A0A2P2QVH4_RHIMU
MREGKWKEKTRAATVIKLFSELYIFYSFFEVQVEMSNCNPTLTLSENSRLGLESCISSVKMIQN